MSFLTLGLSFVAAASAASLLVGRLRRAGIAGSDIHKIDRPEVSEMGGLSLVVGFGAGVLLTIALQTFRPDSATAQLSVLLAVFCTVLLTTLIGIVDDLLGMRQWVKALLPIIAALPLVAVRAGISTMRIPLVGRVDFGSIYALLLVPLGITGAANAVNMLAGFNGLELGMGLIAMGSLAVIASHVGAWASLALLLAGVGAIVGTMPFNWYPARMFVGDVGTLSIGALIAAACIVGNFETAGVIVIIPYTIDFFFKAFHRFPTTGWGGELRGDGKLYCPRHGPVSLCQGVLKVFNGLHERTLVLILMGIEALFGLLAIALYLWV